MGEADRDRERCIRIESVGVFAVAALFSSEGAILFNFAMLLLRMYDLSALLTVRAESVTESPMRRARTILTIGFELLRAGA